MLFNSWRLAIVATCILGEIGVAYAQNAVERFQPLVETTAHRLMIGEQVALAKWDSGKAVEDAPREAHVIQGAVKDGVAKDVEIEAPKEFKVSAADYILGKL